jgi:diaminopimelate decarboxylase
MPEVESGELLWISHSGAYGSSMASHYNVRPQAAEVLVSGKKVTLIRKRESLEEVWRDELHPQSR